MQRTFQAEPPVRCYAIQISSRAPYASFTPKRTNRVANGTRFLRLWPRLLAGQHLARYTHRMAISNDRILDGAASPVPPDTSQSVLALFNSGPKSPAGDSCPAAQVCAFEPGSYLHGRPTPGPNEVRFGTIPHLGEAASNELPVATRSTAPRPSRTSLQSPYVATTLARTFTPKQLRARRGVWRRSRAGAPEACSGSCGT